MRKVKIISVATTALLAVAPVIASPVLAVENTSISTTSQKTESAVNIEFVQNGKTEIINPDGKYFQVSPNSNFNPTNFVGSDGTNYKLINDKDTKVTVKSNTVNTSKAGSTGEVKLKVESNGNTYTINYTVYVRPQGKIQLNLPSDWVYGGFNIGTASVNIFYQGQKYYVGKLTKYEDGQFFTSVSKISESAANQNDDGAWIQTKYLAESESAKPELVKKTIMHKARAYTWGGTKTRKVYSAYTNVYVKNKIIHVDGGKYWTSGDFYQVYNADGTYTNYLIKVGNIDGTKRVLKHNAYIYASSRLRANRTVLKKGTTITTYGDSYKFKNGKHYYRIEGATKTDKRYVKVENFK